MQSRGHGDRKYHGLEVSCIAKYEDAVHSQSLSVQLGIAVNDWTSHSTYRQYARTQLEARNHLPSGLTSVLVDSIMFTDVYDKKRIVAIVESVGFKIRYIPKCSGNASSL